MADEKKTEMNPQTNEQQNKKSDEKNTKKKFWQQKWFKILLPIILIGGGITAYTLLNKKASPDDTDDGGGRLQADPNAGQYVEPEAGEEEVGVAIPGWSSIDIPADTTEVIVDFFNPEENEGKYSLTFELRLLDESEQGYEVLYTSGLVDPGLHIQTINLSRGLEAGTYDAIIHVQPYRMDEAQTATNNADMRTQLIVS